MNSDDGDREELIFDAALQAETERERRDVLERMCGSDMQLRARVEKLLASYAASSSLETPIALTPDFEARFGSLEGKQVGAYEVLQPIGEGGMGEVYLGRSVYTRKLVAIKTIKPGMDTRQVVSRFEQERKALQRLEHPNIAEFIESGVTENGRAFFVMELVRGLPITDYCLRHHFDLVQVLQLFIEVCHAVHYANSCGMVHRDLKPNNLLVQGEDTQPVVKVIDFGISKALSADLKVDTLFTGAVQWLGTPAYMSPEQSQWSGHVDQRSDVYALGVVLFELLTGSTPLALAMPATKSFENARTIIAGGLPPRPSDVLRVVRRKGDAAGSLTSGRFAVERIRGDLDWIVLKALEKQPPKRYQSVDELRHDLVAFLSDEPVTATRPAHMQSIRRVAHFMRHSRVLWGVVVAIAIVVGSALGSQLSKASLQLFGAIQKETSSLSNQDMRARAPDGLVEPSEKQENIERRAFIGSVRRVDSLRNVGRVDEALSELDSLKQTHPQWRDHFLVRYLQHTIRKPGIFETGAVREIGEIDLSPNGDYLVMGDGVGNVKLWNWPSGELRHNWKVGSQEIQRIRIAPNSLWLATAGQDKEVRVWDVALGQLLNKGLGHERTITGLSWSTDNQRLATSDRDGVVIVWNVADMSVIKQLKVDGAARTVEFSYDGNYLAASNEKTGTQVWNTADWSAKAFIPTSESLSGDYAIAFSHNGRTMAVAGGGPVRVYDLQTGLTTFSPSSHQVRALRFGPHGNLFIGRDNAYVDIANVDRGWRRLASVKVSHETDGVRTIDFLNDNRTLAVGMGKSGLLRWINIESILGYEFRLYDGIPLGYNDELKMSFEIKLEPSVLEGRRDDKLVYSLPTDTAIDQVPPLYFKLQNGLVFSTRDGTNSHVRLVGLADNRVRLRSRIPLSTKQIKSIDAQHTLLTMSRTPAMIWNIESDHLVELKCETLTANCVGDYGKAKGEVVVAQNATSVLHRFSIEGNHLGEVEHNRRIFSLDYDAHSDTFVVGEIGSVSIWSSDLQLQHSVLLDESDQQSPVVIAKSFPGEELLAVVTEDGTLRLVDMRTRLLAIELPTYFPSDPHRYFVGFENPDRLAFGYGGAKQVLTLSAVPVSSPSQSAVR